MISAEAGKGVLRAMCKGEGGGPEGHTACMGLHKDTQLSQSCRQSLSVSGGLCSLLCGQWEERGLWFLGIVSTRAKVLKNSTCV